MPINPEILTAKCPKCRTALWARRKGEWTLRNRIIKLVDGKIVALCDDCGSPVSVDWLAIAPIEQAPPMSPAVRLVARLPKT
jgi:RNase P subunit RPR2